MNRFEFERKLGNIDWTQYSGAFGTDFLVGEHLLKSASSDEAEALESTGQVIAHACHQGVLEEMPFPKGKVR